MKNFFKARIVPFLGVIALAAVIGFSMTACADDDEDILEIDSAIHGTWKGDSSNGTLVVTANAFSSPDKQTLASDFVKAFNKLNGEISGVKYSIFKVSDGEIKVRTSVKGVTVKEYVAFNYSVTNSVLKIKDGEGLATEFEGTKQ